MCHTCYKNLPPESGPWHRRSWLEFQPCHLFEARPSPGNGVSGRPAPAGQTPAVWGYLDSEPPHGAHGDPWDGSVVVGWNDGALLGAPHARHALCIPETERKECREQAWEGNGAAGGTRGAAASPCPSPSARTTWPKPSSPSSYSLSASPPPAPPRWRHFDTQGSTCHNGDISACPQPALDLLALQTWPAPPSSLPSSPVQDGESFKLKFTKIK